MSRFRDEQVRRYSRQILLPEVGGTGQERLLGARVLVRAGEGSSARAAATYLAAAGVGHLVLEGVPAPGAFGWGADLATLNPDVTIEERPAAPARAPDASFDAVVDLSGPDAPPGPAAAVRGAFAAAEALKELLRLGVPAPEVPC